MKKYTIIFVALLLIGLVACSKKTDNNENVDQPEKEPPDQVKEDVEYHVFPFTGLETTDDISQRAIAVMVSNQKQARPQSGVSKADIVFEMLTEGNVTRYMAIFHSNPPDAVGPVRSAREYFFTLADNYDAIYVYQGAADFINDMILQRDIDHIHGAHYDNDGHLFVREDFRVTPHNSYLQFGAVYDVAQEKGY